MIELLTQNIATGDESWVHHYNPENKRQSMEYRHSRSPNVKYSKLFHQQKKKSSSPTFGIEGRALHGISD